MSESNPGTSVPCRCWPSTYTSTRRFRSKGILPNVSKSKSRSVPPSTSSSISPRWRRTRGPFPHCRRVSSWTPKVRCLTPTKTPSNWSPYFSVGIEVRGPRSVWGCIKVKVLPYCVIGTSGDPHPVTQVRRRFSCRHTWGPSRESSWITDTPDISGWPFQTSTGFTPTTTDPKRTSGKTVTLFKEDRGSTRTHPLPYILRNTKEGKRYTHRIQRHKWVQR